MATIPQLPIVHYDNFKRHWRMLLQATNQRNDALICLSIAVDGVMRCACKKSYSAGATSRAGLMTMRLYCQACHERSTPSKKTLTIHSWI
eukprot:scaffold195466_cov20-Prasinocladus_malaysianus.AAC.3